MQWTDFGPYVMPYVTGCPEPVMVHHVRLAAIEFCRKTLCWTEKLDPVLTDGTEVVEMDVDAHTNIVKPKAVFVDGVEWTLVEPIIGNSMVSEQSGERFCFTPDKKVLHLYPVQEIGVEVVVRAALCPSLKSTSCIDAIAEHTQDIAAGAIASIMRLPKQDFTNMADSAVHEAQFRGRISTVAMKVGRGNLAARLGGSTEFM